MNKLFLVFKHEYVRRVKTKGFIFAVISMPLIVFLGIGLGVVSARMQSNPLPIGYLDQSGLFKNASLKPETYSTVIPPVDIFQFENEETGTNAIETGEIQALFFIAPDYLKSGKIEVLAPKPPGQNAYDRMDSFLKNNLISLDPSSYIERVKSGSDYTVQALDGSRKANMRDWFVVLFPFMTGLIFIIVINISGGYLMQSVVDEKENRTMEMVVTSVSPQELMIGKILGNLGVGLSQLAIWLFFTFLGALSVQLFFGYTIKPDILPVHYVLFFGIIFPGFILVAALMTLVGVTAASLREAQQISVLFTLPMVAPYYFAGAVLQHPNHPLAQAMSIFPLTAVVTMPLRVAIGEVPGWQLILTVLLMYNSALIALLLASKIFRLAMLQVGRRLPLRQLIFKNKLRDNHE